MNQLYDYPKYYEIAMSFRDIPNEVNVFEECIKRFSRVTVKSMLEVGCGNAPHILELGKRGYKYTGLDLNENMLAYSREKAERHGVEATFVQGPMSAFRIEPPVDFAYIMLGSLYVADTVELVAHFDSLAASLKPGGLYLMDWCLRTWGMPGIGDPWEMEQDGIKVRIKGGTSVVDPIAQTFLDMMDFEVDDHGQHYTVSEKNVVRAVYPQEFLLFLKQHGGFEFVGWWNNWDLDQPLEGIQNLSRPITVIRRV